MECLFCAIVAGDLPSRQVYADDDAFAFLDINPAQRGHTLVIPRRHVRDLVEQPQALTEIAPAVEKMARILTDALQPAGLNLLASQGEAAGQEVFHLHVHLIPRYADRPGLRAMLEPNASAGDDLDAVHAQLTGGRPIWSADQAR